jgi:hypothetical protein
LSRQVIVDAGTDATEGQADTEAGECELHAAVGGGFWRLVHVKEGNKGLKRRVEGGIFQ